MSERPSVLLIVLDALRADCVPGAEHSPHLRSLGLRRPHMPALAALVQGAAHFRQAMACSAYTTAAVGSIFTGLLPAEHGVRAFDLTSLSRQVRTLAEILADAGYATCAMTDQPPVLQPMGLLRGFQTVLPTEDEALAWWDSYEEMPRFLFLHLWDAHKPYGMPFGRAYRATYPQIINQWRERLHGRGIPEPASDEFLDGNEERRQVYLMQLAWEDRFGFKAGLETYLSGLETFDRGRLHALIAALQARRIPAENIAVVLSDHGEGRDFPPSWRMTHGMSLADDVMHIPLYMHIPNVTKGQAIPQQVSQADVTPTILDALGLLAERTPPRSAYNGRSLLPLLRGESLPNIPAYAEVSALNNDPGKPVAQSGGARAATLRFRVLRYPKRKYHLAGRLFELDEAALSASSEDFVRLVCRNLLGRIERTDDFAAWLPVLEDASLPVEARRQAVVKAVENSDEYRFLTKYAIFDLHRDPLEEKPIDPRQSAADWADYCQQVAIMEEIDRNARPGEPLLTNEADEVMILKRLRNLGYIE